MQIWKPIEPKVWKPQTSGDSIMGVLVNKTPRNENTGISAKYQIENKEGMFLIWGTVVLDDRMQYVPVGSKVRIAFLGKTQNKRNQQVNLFKVEVAEFHPEQDSTEQDTPATVNSNVSI